MQTGKLIIFSAPSGSGKSTIVNYLLGHEELNLQFSVSATCRLPRGTESHGKEYYFFTQEDFKTKIEKEEFLEYEEVYPGCFYGTLRSEVERITNNGGNVIFDVDVVGGCNIKKYYGDKALAVFIKPPSIEELRRRLEKRGTDSAEVINQRIEKAEYELTFAPKFDVIINNDILEKAQQETLEVVSDFLER